MAFKFVRKAAVPVLAVALIATSTVGIAVASSKSSGAKACETKKGVLVLASSKGKCAHGDKKVTLGKTGAKGAKGDTGLTGPSDGYVDTLRALTPLTIGDTIMSLALPKGSYLLNSSINFSNTSTAANPGCYFQVGSAKSVEYQIDIQAESGTPPITFDGYGEISMSAGLTLPAAATVDVVCGSPATVKAQGSFTAQVTGALAVSGNQPFA